MTNLFIPMSGNELRKLLLEKGYVLASIASRMGISPQDLNSKLNAKSLKLDFIDKLERAIGKTVDELADGKEPISKPTGDDLRNKKAFGGSTDTGLIFVPISAQAGYTLHYTEPIFIEQLERVLIPGMPYRGERFRIFEVEGDSMEKTLQEGYYVIAERLEEWQWDRIADFYIYVIITETQILIKRLFKKDTDHYVMISDNDEYYPQQLLEKKMIRELWLVKRKLDWNMPPPKRFDITV
jgi:phage repressor protein C with HTH and peptisase S24 domain